MQTEAVFENSASRIQEEINKTQKSIYIAGTWFTNKNIFDQLLQKKEDYKSSCYWLSKLYDNSMVLTAATPVLPMHRDKQLNRSFIVRAAQATKS